MFTGMIDHCGEILSIVDIEQGRRISIATQFSDIELGESIAIDGACLTATTIEDNIVTFDLSSETLDKTIAADYKCGDNVNLERALCLGERLGGHIVLGHVDTTALLIKKDASGECICYQFSDVPPAFMKMLMPKGSVAVNGVSLTVNEIFDDGFTVMLIPHTLEITNLSGINVEQTVNIECDTIARVIMRQGENYVRNTVC